MTNYWITKKTLVGSDYRVNFDWLMEDVSDPMSDSTSPEMAHTKNRIVATKHSEAQYSMNVTVPKGLGNLYYTRIKSFISEGKPLDSLLDALSLSVCIYNDNYDNYSDIYKDIHDVRPRINEEEWDRLVQGIRKVGA